MQEVENLIEIYHTASFISLILGILLLALSVLLFFKFDILKIFDMKTGRGARRTIQRMEEMNALTGKLREEPSTGYTESSVNTADRITYPVTASDPKIHDEVMATGEENTAALNTGQGSEDTTLLYESPETTILYEEPGTTVLSEKESPPENSRPEEKGPGTFKVEKEILLIHTQERI